MPNPITIISTGQYADIELLINHIKSIENNEPLRVYRDTNNKPTNKVKRLKAIMFNLIVVNIVLIIIYAFNH